MRHAGTIDREDHANRFVDYMLTQGVKTRVDAEDGLWTIWVYDEDQLEDTQSELDWFLGNPDDPTFDAAIKAAQIRREQTRQEKQARKQFVRVRDQWSKPQRGVVTTTLIIVCVVVGVITWFGKKKDPVAIALSVNTYTPTEKGGSWNPNDHLVDIKTGQVWRLVTPMLLHFGPLHLVMNMFAFHFFGNFIESRRGPIFMGVLVLMLAVFSNAMQYQFSPNQSPVFGGMSGVGFGLFGYLWAKTVFDPGSGMNLQPSTIFMMMLWFVLCFTGAFGSIANIAHTAGLVAGGILGAVSTFAKEAPRPGK